MEQLLTQEAPDLYEELQTRLVKNTVIIEDNSVDVQLDSSVTYTAVTEEYPMAIDISQLNLIQKEGFDALCIWESSLTPHIKILQLLTCSI